MKRRTKILLFTGGGLLLAAIVGANLVSGERAGTSVFVEKVGRRALEAVVRESGKVRAKTSVPLSANTVGQIQDVLVREGDRVTTGQVLIQIDPTPFETAVVQAEAAVRDAETRLAIARAQIERTKKRLSREEGIYTLERKEELTADLEVQQREAEAADLHLSSEKARLKGVRHDLTKVRITSPIDGVVLRINVEKGQNTVMGTMNSPGTELLTVADTSVLQLELEVGEAAIVDVRPQQEARISIDALPDRSFKGRVTEVGTSPLPAPAGGQERGVLFRVLVTLEDAVEGIRPGFSATAEIVTATRADTLAVPIRAVVARDDAGTKKQIEGVMAAKDGRARFVTVKLGITGKEHFEVLEGLSEGDEVVTGPHKSLRDLKDDERIEPRAE